MSPLANVGCVCKLRIEINLVTANVSHFAKMAL